jgi:hypothetical protein
MPSRLAGRALALALGIAVLLPAACHRMTEEEALESARQEVRQELKPEVEKRRREIEDLKRQIELERAKLAARKGRADAPVSP